MNTIHFHSCSQLNWLEGEPIVRLYKVLIKLGPLSGTLWGVRDWSLGYVATAMCFTLAKQCVTPHTMLHVCYTHTHTQQGGCGATAEKKDIVDNCPLLKFNVGSFRIF